MLFYLQLLGTPTESDLGFVRNEDAKRYIRQLPRFPRQQLASVFSHINPLAIDLIDKMLTFDPAKRITGEFRLPKLISFREIFLYLLSFLFFFIILKHELSCNAVDEALAHPYLARLHDTADEPVCSEPFSFDFEQQAFGEEQIKDMIYQEALALNPEYA